MKQVQQTAAMITKSGLRVERGWTDALIRSFLPTPDLVKQNPHYKSGPPMQLYNLERIEAIERTDEFKSRERKAEQRKVAALKALETKLERLEQYVDSIVIEVPVMARSELIKRACEHYNCIQSEREALGNTTCGLLATPDSDPEFIDRICVNYLRHCLTSYERHLDEMSGKVGFSEAYQELGQKVFAAISEKYGWLAEECERQEERRANGGEE